MIAARLTALGARVRTGAARTGVSPNNSYLHSVDLSSK